MEGLPEQRPPDGVDVFTGLVCPDCRGSLAARLQVDRPVRSSEPAGPGTGSAVPS